ncbi:MAG: hypothetical protein KJ968_05030, partial [Nanoarchaeota archaeon]|nr:hypothetical protein [Nanoarchaeota archaeon]
MGGSITEIIEKHIRELNISPRSTKKILKEVVGAITNIEEIKASEGLCKRLGINYKNRIKEIEEEKGNKLIKKLDKGKTEFNKSFVKKLEQICRPDQIKTWFLYYISIKARQHNEKLVLSEDLMKVDYLNVFIKELSKTFKNLIKTYSAKGKKILESESKNYAKEYHKKNRIAKLEEELSSKYGITGKESIEAKGVSYLKIISEGKEKDEAGELVLKLLKCTGVMGQWQIRNAKQKRYDYFRKKSLEKTKEETASEETLDEKTNELQADDYDKNESLRDLIKTINDDKKEPHRDLIKTINYDKKEPYESLIEKIEGKVSTMPGKTKKQIEKIREFIVEKLARYWGEYNIKSPVDIINVKRPFADKYFGNFENFDNALNNKAEEILSKICNGTLIVKKSYEKYISFIDMEGYPEGRITSAISSGKNFIMKYVCQELQRWIRLENKNKKHYDKNSLENGLKIDEPIKLSSVTNLFDK